MYKDRELLKKANYNDRDYKKLKAEQDKQKAEKKQREHLEAQQNYVLEDDPIYKGITYVGKGIYNLGKGAIEVGKTTGNTLINAYKISTGSIEIVNTDADGKTQVVIKNPESNTTASNNNSTATTTTISTTTTPSHITSKTIEVKNQEGGAPFKFQEKTIKTSLKFKLNKQHIVEVKEYRDITFSDTMDGYTKDGYTKDGYTKDGYTKDGYTKDGYTNLQFVLYEPNGSKPTTTNASYLKLDYNDSGKIIKLSLPNPPVLSSKPLYPACTIYHGKLYTLPVNSGHYEHLTQKIHENGGVVEIGHADPAYHIEAIYD